MNSSSWLPTRRGYFAQAPGQLKLTNDQLMEIILAQDFQDLTGQVIKKIVELVQGVETQLLACCSKQCRRTQTDAPEGLLNGPVIGGEGRRRRRHQPVAGR
jgi:chemotaxis protein CheZ